MKHRQEEATFVSKWVRPVIIGTIIGALVCLVILFLFAALMAAQDIPKMAVTPMAVVAAALGAFVAGFSSARVAGVRGLLYGVLCGIVLYVLILLAGFGLLQDVRGWFALIKLLICMICAGIGGVIGVNFRKR